MDPCCVCEIARKRLSPRLFWYYCRRDGGVAARLPGMVISDCVDCSVDDA